MRTSPLFLPVAIIGAAAIVPSLVAQTPVGGVMSLLVLAALSYTVLIPRIRAERRARALAAAMPDGELSTVYLAFPGRSSTGPSAKLTAFDLKIASMARAGWLYLRASEANPLKTILTRGGGLNLQFIRPRPS